MTGMLGGMSPRLRSTLFFASLALTLPLAAHAQAAALLNGKDLSAWQYVTTPATEMATVFHYQADGSLAVAGKPVGYLATKATYTDYKLHAEWRWPANAAKNSNSGVLLHIASGPTGGTAWPVCFQMQMKLGHAGDMLPMDKAKFGETLSTPPGAKTPQLDRAGGECEKPLGEWNTCDIVCRGGTIEVTINGKPESKVTQCAPASGTVGFQLEGTPYELRNVTIEALK